MRECAEWSALIANIVTIPPVPIQKSIIHIYRHSSGQLDWDNCYSSFKCPLDVIVSRTKKNPHGLGIIYDDSPDYLVELRAYQVKCKRGEGKTVIHIFDLSEKESVNGI